MTRSRVGIGLLACMALYGAPCGAMGTDGGTPPPPTPTPPPPPADAGPRGDPGSLPASVRAVVEAYSAGGGAAAALAGPLVPEGNDLGMRDRPVESVARQAVEDGVANNSIVTSAGCVTFAWSGLMATVTFRGCVLEVTGEALDGAITLAVALSPTSFALTLGDLTLGDGSYDGTIALTFGATMGATLDADLDVATGGGATTVSLDAVRVTTSASSVALGGAAQLTTPTVSASVVATAVTWRTGDCHPSSGTVTYTDATAGDVTITFLPTTPQTGDVLVTIPGVPIPLTYALLAPCP